MSSRRSFIKRVIGVSAGVGVGAAATASAQGGPIAAFDHVAVPMQNIEAMVAFYRALGFGVMEGARTCSVHMAHQKINFHRPEHWQSGDVHLAGLESGASVRRLLLRVGGRSAGARGEAQGGRRGGRGRTGRPYRWARPGHRYRDKLLHPRSGRESARVHHLLARISAIRQRCGPPAPDLMLGGVPGCGLSGANRLPGSRTLRPQPGSTPTCDLELAQLLHEAQHVEVVPALRHLAAVALQHPPGAGYLLLPRRRDGAARTL